MSYKVIKHLKQDFYEDFCKLCDLHKFPRIHIDLLPEICFACYLDEVLIYSVWLYRTDSKLAWIAFPISNNKILHKKRKGGLDYLFNFVENYCKKKGIKMIFTTSSTEKIIETVINQGWQEGDANVNHYTKIL
jgi:hypothetical protein